MLSASLLIVVTDTKPVLAAKSGSLCGGSTNAVTMETWSPSNRSSSTPITVTLRGMFQFVLVNVSVAGLTMTSPVSLLETLTTTLLDGFAVSTMLNESVEPSSPTIVLPDDSMTLRPGAEPDW